jgi:D-serine deaminase-like pyridoxal phosphate-dependent protein
VSDFPQLQRELETKRLPAIVVDLAAFDRNARALAERLRERRPDLKIRLATKSLRVPALIRRALDSSPVYQGLMCYAAEEIAFLAERGFDDFLLAYPTLQSSSLDTLARCASRKKVSVVVDSEEGIAALAVAARKADAVVGCTLELDVSWRICGGFQLGARRSPLKSAADLARLHAIVAARKELRFDGLMAYEGQVAGVPDRSAFKNPLVNLVTSWLRRKEARAVARRRARVLAELKSLGICCALVNGGGSGSLSYALEEPGLTEIAAGSALVASHLFSAYSNLDVQPALYVALEVVRRSDEGWLTCSGGGYVASGAPGWDRLPMPVFPRDATLSPLEGCGEVQTPLRVAAETSREFPLGRAAFFRPAKAGEIAERFASYQLWDGKTLVEAPTYRGLGECYQ